MFTKNFMGVGGQFSWGKINPGKCLPGTFRPEICPPSPKEKKKKIDSRKYYLLGKK